MFTRAGAAAVGYHKRSEVFHHRLGLGGQAESFDGEMAGLMIAAKKAVEYTNAHPQINRIYIFADCTAAIAAIHEPKPRAAQRYAAIFREKILDLLDHHPNIKVELSWCPSHCGIKGNERSDELAKQATNLA